MVGEGEYFTLKLNIAIHHSIILDNSELSLLDLGLESGRLILAGRRGGSENLLEPKRGIIFFKP